MDFYQANVIENWTFVILMKHYRSKKKHKDRKQILDSIKKDLEEIEGSISFDIVKKEKLEKSSTIGRFCLLIVFYCAKKWTASVKNLKQDCEHSNIRYLQRNVTNVNNPDDKITPRKSSSNKVDKPSENNVPSNDDPNEIIEFEYNELDKLEQQITSSSLNEWDIGMVNVSRKFKEALSSIIVMCWPCPYPTFTSSEWRQVLNSNPYKITQSVLTDSLLITLYKATNDFSLGLNHNFILNNDGELGEKANRIFNYIKDELPLSSKRKETENKHCVYYLDPSIKLIFGGEYTPYSLELNKSPLGYTQLRKDQDFVKVHLKGKKSINKLLEKGGPNKSIAFLNMELFVIDLAYDGVYRSWPCLKNKLAIDKGSFLLSQYLNEIVNDYENRSPSEQIEELKFIRRMPTATQFKLLLKQ
ncbi:hypothetical protein C2G38_2173514 [Gigaspora rosea]|uniref:Uncharacterized protein n=1 Tax=Gigaspora rosea TaxID=44941 RepID=A0A397VNQ9_9GLOM|nr:hypothetical protein C2G38_2173514 [Gigaspora rosea]